MASANPFDLLLHDDAGDPSALLAAVQLKIEAAAAAEKKAAAVATTKTSKMPTKPLPPTQAVREAMNEGARGGRGSRGGGGYGRGARQGGGMISNNEKSFSNGNGFSIEQRTETNEKRRSYDDSRRRGGRRGGFNNENFDGERPRRNYERHSGNGRSSEIKRDGAGRGNWGTTAEDIAPEIEQPTVEEVNATAEKPAEEGENAEAKKETDVSHSPEEDPEEKQMTLEEYEKVLEEKRKVLLSLNEEKKGEERKIDVKEFQAMQLVSKKKNVDDEVSIKLGSEKDKKREAAERDEKAKKSVSINEFLKPAEGEGYYRSGGRGRGGRDRGGGRGGRHGGGGSYPRNNGPAPKIGDELQFPTLGGN